MKKIYQFISSAFLVALSSSLFAQGDPIFTQYQATPLELNPANAGLFEGSFRGIVNYRRQWENIGTVFQTIGASGDFRVAQDVFKDDLFSVGINVLQDKAGVGEATNLNANLNISYTKILDRYANHYFSVGFMTGFAQKSLGVSNLRWNNQWTDDGFNTDLPSGEGSIDDSKTHLDIGGGINYFFSNTDESVKGFVGASMFHITRPSVSFMGVEEKLYSKFIYNAGVEFRLRSSMISFFPNAIVATQGPNSMIMLGGDMKFYLSEGTKMTGFLKESTLAFGIYHRWGDSFSPMLKLGAGGFQLGVSYDITIRSLTRVNRGFGGPEFSLIYRTGYKSGTRSASRTKFM